MFLNSKNKPAVFFLAAVVVFSLCTGCSSPAATSPAAATAAPIATAVTVSTPIPTVQVTETPIKTGSIAVDENRRVEYEVYADGGIIFSRYDSIGYLSSINPTDFLPCYVTDAKTCQLVNGWQVRVWTIDTNNDGSISSDEVQWSGPNN